MSDPLSLSLDLLRRLPPSAINDNLNTVAQLCPSVTEDLYSSVDQPLSVQIDDSPEGAGREFLTCDYNRDGDSWRSPWSSNYFPPLADGTQPSPKLRQLEIKANEVFETYRQMYFDGGLCSVNLWDLDDGFAGAVLIKKDLSQSSQSGTSGNWDSLHVFEVNERPGGKAASYKVTSTVMLSVAKQHLQLLSSNGGIGSVPSKHVDDKTRAFDLSGSLTRQEAHDYPVTDQTSHIANVGRVVESIELKIRNELQEIYFGKTRDVVRLLRSEESLEKERAAKNLQKELMGLWKK